MFLQNQKILNLCLRWHIFRGYCFVVEVTFNDANEYIIWESLWYDNENGEENFIFPNKYAQYKRSPIFSFWRCGYIVKLDSYTFL